MTNVARYDKHYPGGRKLGVRRGTLPGGSLDYNGHVHIREATRMLVLGFVGRLGRATTAREVASELPYSFGYVQALLRALTADGDLTATEPGRRGYPILYTLPAVPAVVDDSRRKVCSKCKQNLPWEAYGADRAQPCGIRPDCKRCRSLRPEIYRPNRTGVTT